MLHVNASEKFGWNKRKSTPGSVRDGRWLFGVGVATATYSANQRASSAKCRVKAEGSVLVEAATQDIGTGTYTIMAQIAADALGTSTEKLPFDLWRFEDTPYACIGRISNGVDHGGRGQGRTRRDEGGARRARDCRR